MITAILSSYIASHGYFDVLKFRDKLFSSYVYISLGMSSIWIWKVLPSSMMLFLILMTYQHFQNDFNFVFNNNKAIQGAPVSMFTGMMVGSYNYNYWISTLNRIGFWSYEPQIFYLTLAMINTHKIYHNGNSYKVNILAFLYGILLGPYWAIFIYMLFHSTLALFRSYHYDFFNPINRAINIKPNNFWLMLILTNMFNLYIHYTETLYSIREDILVSLIVSVLVSHLLVHNYGLLNDLEK